MVFLVVVLLSTDIHCHCHFVVIDIAGIYIVVVVMVIYHVNVVDMVRKVMVAMILF